MRMLMMIAVAATMLCGCASGAKKTEAKRIYERPWIGGTFKQVSTPRLVRAGTNHFGRQALILTRVREGTPLAQAGMQEGDVLLALNGKNLHSERDVHKIINRSGPGTVSARLYRSGEISEKTITPGIERFQKMHTISFGVGVATYMVFDLFPNPDFSLVAVGYEAKSKRLDLQDATAKYRREQGKYLSSEKDGWRGLPSDEGWKAWLGPISVSGSKTIIAQEPTR